MQTYGKKSTYRLIPYQNITFFVILHKLFAAHLPLASDINLAVSRAHVLQLARPLQLCGKAVSPRARKMQLPPQVARRNERLLGKKRCKRRLHLFRRGNRVQCRLIGSILEVGPRHRFQKRLLRTEVHGAHRRIAQPEAM